MPCEVKYRFDRVQYYNSVCKEDGLFCYWYVIEEEGYRVWRLLHKDCECPCDCEDPERVGYSKYDLQLFSGECPEYLVPNRGLGEISDLPESQQDQLLPKSHFRKTRCTYAIKDCKIRFERYDEGAEVFYYPVVIKEYDPKIPCTYVNNIYDCTEQEIFKCWRSPDYDVTYDVDYIPEDEFEKLGLPEEVPCNIEIRCWPPCEFEESKIFDYWNELRNFFNNEPISSGYPIYGSFDIPFSLLNLFRPYLPNEIQVEGAEKTTYYYDPYVQLIPCYSPRAIPQTTTQEPDYPVGSCIHIILPNGLKYVYSTCPDGAECEPVDLAVRDRSCPDSTYVVVATGCIYPTTTTTTPSPSPYPPFCAWGSVPNATLEYVFYFLDDDISFRDGLKIGKVHKEKVTGRYYDIRVKSKFEGGKFIVYDAYGNVWYHNKVITVTPYSICNDSQGRTEMVFFVSGYRDDQQLPEEWLNEVLNQHKAKCGNIPFCCSEILSQHSKSLSLENYRHFLPVLLTEDMIVNDQAIEPLKTFGLNYYGYIQEYGFFGETSGHLYLMEDSLFRGSVDKICKFKYDGGSWQVEGSCGNCDIYKEMLDAALKACFRRHPFYNFYGDWSWRIQASTIFVYPASKLGCLCTVQDALDFITQYYPIEIYLTCPQPLPDSDYLIVDEIGTFFGGSPFFIFLPCGENKAPETLEYEYRAVIPCVEEEDIEFQEGQTRLFYAIIPWYYRPCIIKTTTTTTTTSTTEEPVSDPGYFSPRNIKCN